MMNSNLNLAKLPECVCEMRYIDSALLTPCAEYQRVLRTRKVEEISATFSEYVANEPRVSYRDGRYHVFDGQNTIVLTSWQKMRMLVHLLQPPKQLVLLLHWMASEPSGRSTASALPIIFTRTTVLTSIRKP